MKIFLKSCTFCTDGFKLSTLSNGGWCRLTQTVKNSQRTRQTSEPLRGVTGTPQPQARRLLVRCGALWPRALFGLPKSAYVPRRACGSNEPRLACSRYLSPFHELCTYRFSIFALDLELAAFIPRRKAFKISSPWHRIGMGRAWARLRLNCMLLQVSESLFRAPQAHVLQKWCR